MKTLILAVVLFVHLAAQPTSAEQAQVSGPAAASQQGSAHSTTLEVHSRACRTVPALTPVLVELLVHVGSKVSSSGDMIPIRLAAPIVSDGIEVVPAGAMGMAEVVHAKKAEKQGLLKRDAPGGEFIAAARFIEFNGQRIELRSLRLAGKGADKTTKVIATATVAVAFNEDEPGEADVLFPAGTIAEAKLAKGWQESVPTCLPKP